MHNVNVSVVIPVYNERDNICPVYAAVTGIMSRIGREYEIVFVDDGSTDDTPTQLRQLAAADHRVKVVEFRRNYGQTAAMHAGLQHAVGDAIVTMDGDMQNDPADIPAMLAKIDEGYDVVHGWRKHRQDPWLNRKLPSKIANWIISRATGFPIHDLGCTLKVIRRDIAQELELYGEMHRFIPISAHERGARCVEVPTAHHPRRFGKTKYGIGRTLRVVLDLITVKYMLDYFASPMKLFGKLGFLCGLVGVVSGAATVAMKMAGRVDMTGNPLLMLTVFSWMAGIQLLSLGLLGEVAARIYFSTANHRNYAVRTLTNFSEAPSAGMPSDAAAPSADPPPTRPIRRSRAA